ncbi:hypothetical protein ACVDG5_031290 [Mesorhizobium sp. ORM6]
MSLLTVAALAQTTTQPPVATPPVATPLAATPQTAAPETPKAKSDLTLAKFQKRREKAIMAADTDGDGKISLLEWEAFQAKRNIKGDPARSFARIDSES